MIIEQKTKKHNKEITTFKMNRRDFLELYLTELQYHSDEKVRKLGDSIIRYLDYGAADMKELKLDKILDDTNIHIVRSIPLNEIVQYYLQKIFRNE